jgi:CCR4-NOT transcription complex subunit 1
MKVYYDGVLRILVAILHDYPEFLSEYHFNFVNKLPDHFIQLRNIILSAFPGYIDPPQPFQTNLKIDLLPDIKTPPTIASQYHNYLKYKDLKDDLDSYFMNLSNT